MGGNTIRDMPGVFDVDGNLVGFVNLKGEEQPVGAGAGLPVGGATGQVLVKLSNNPGDAAWSNVGAGDVTQTGAQTLTNKTLTAPTLNGNIGGSPVLPTTVTVASTPTAGDNTTKVATTAFVATAAAAKVANDMTASTTVAPSKSAVQVAIDAKVANDLTASTTVAPSKSAVQAALDAKVANDLTASTTVAPSKTAVANAIAAVVANDLTPSTTIAPSKTAVASAIAAKVEDNLTASTSVAPSKTAVVGALSAKADTTAVNSALALKADALAETNLGVSTSYSLFFSTHANRSLRAAPTAPATVTVDTTTGSPPSGTVWEVTNEGSASMTFTGATAASGDTNVLTAGRTGQVKLVNGTLRSLIQSTTGGGSNPATIAPTTGTAGQVLTLTYATGWNGPIQWRKDGADVSGATSSTLNTTTPGAGTYDAVVGSPTGLRYTTNTSVIAAAVTSREDTFNRANSSTLGTPSDGGSSWAAGTHLECAIVGNKVSVPADSNYYGGALATSLSNLELTAYSVESDTNNSPFLNGLLDLRLRYQDANNFVFLRLNDYAWQIKKKVAGVETLVADGTHDMSAGDVSDIRITASGTSISAWKRVPATSGTWTQMGTTQTVSDLTSATGISFLMQLTSHTYRRFDRITAA